MSTVTYPRRTTWTARLIGAGGALAVVTAGAVGGTYLWQWHTAPTAASTADCKLAQQLVDRTPPAEASQADAWEQQIRQVRYTQMRDGGLSTQVGKYAHWVVVKATGAGEKPTSKQIGAVLDEANGHCRDSGVKLAFPAL